jgi:hypothetical protein
MACAGVLIACGEDLEEPGADGAPEVQTVGDPPEPLPVARAPLGHHDAHRLKLEAAALRADLRFGSARRRTASERLDGLAAEAP